MKNNPPAIGIDKYRQQQAHREKKVVRKKHLTYDLDQKELTPQEKEVLKLVKQGKSNRDIAVIRDISERTVRFHISNAMQKLEAENRTHAVVLAMEQGVFEKITS